jgi:hypothetical protein
MQKLPMNDDTLFGLVGQRKVGHLHVYAVLLDIPNYHLAPDHPTRYKLS